LDAENSEIYVLGIAKIDKNKYNIFISNFPDASGKFKNIFLYRGTRT
jgi:hypothetical protein